MTLLSSQNTYRRGPSHAGVYLGAGQFVHAVDEAHGVLVNRLDSGYWAAHFYAAARLLPVERDPPDAS